MGAFHPEEVGIADDPVRPGPPLRKFDRSRGIAGGRVPVGFGGQRWDRQPLSVFGDDEVVGVKLPPGVGLVEAKPHDEERIALAGEDRRRLFVGRKLEFGQRRGRDLIAQPERRRPKIFGLPFGGSGNTDRHEERIDRPGQKVPHLPLEEVAVPEPRRAVGNDRHRLVVHEERRPTEMLADLRSQRPRRRLSRPRHQKWCQPPNLGNLQSAHFH